MRIGDGLKGKRVLITQSETFMGPVLEQAFAEHGAVVIGVPGPLEAPGAAEDAVRRAGRVDVLIANLGVPAPSTRAHEVGDDEWRHVFANLVDPLPREASPPLSEWRICSDTWCAPARRVTTSSPRPIQFSMPGLSSTSARSEIRHQGRTSTDQSPFSKPAWAITRFQLRDSGSLRPLDWWLKPRPRKRARQPRNSGSSMPQMPNTSGS